ncbi:MAG TPA: hypothetical protein VKL19_12335 [Thermoanaerobaculia bacterium]|nr:hypothetical protein [Thermoanaerobaculia bacterium]
MAVAPLVWLAILALAVPSIPLQSMPGERVRRGIGDWLLAAVASAPAFVYLALTWSQEFPYGGDQTYHNGAALEAYAFWWWLPWLGAIAALVIVVRWPQLALPGLILLALVSIAAGSALSFAGRYPGTLHFVAVPLRVLPFRSPLNVERLLNVLSIPVWLLVLRPLIVRRAADISALAISLFLFWQKDNVYYFTSGYLEPWAIVLLLTAGEHLVRFGPEMIWRPILLIGAAAMVKEHVILSLPVIALVYFPFRASRRERIHYVLTVAAAVVPFVLFFFVRGSFKTWRGAWPLVDAFSGEHLAAFAHRVQLEFGAAIPVVIFASCALLVLGMRNRAFAALLVAALLDWLFFFTASVQQPWAGYPRTNLVPLAYAAIALGYVVERSKMIGVITLLALIAVLNGIVLLPFLRDATRPDDARNFFEHSDAPIFYPIREGLRLLAPNEPVALLNNGKWTYFFFYPGPIQEQYPDLAASHKILVKSFAGDQQRCRCTADGANLALFIRVDNPTIESEAERCRQEMLASCGRTQPIIHEGVPVGLLGWKRQ